MTNFINNIHKEVKPFVKNVNKELENTKLTLSQVLNKHVPYKFVKFFCNPCQDTFQQKYFTEGRISSRAIHLFYSNKLLEKKKITKLGEMELMMALVHEMSHKEDYSKTRNKRGFFISYENDTLESYYSDPIEIKAHVLEFIVEKMYNRKFSMALGKYQELFPVDHPTMKRFHKTAHKYWALRD